MNTVNLIRYVIGAFCLAMAMLCIALAAPAAAGSIFFPNELPTGIVFLLFGTGLFFILLAAYLWIRAVKLTPGDDILSDERGLLVALMVVTTLLLGGGMLWFTANPGFWRGTIDGMIEGSSK